MALLVLIVIGVIAIIIVKVSALQFPCYSKDELVYSFFSREVAFALGQLVDSSIDVIHASDLGRPSKLHSSSNYDCTISKSTVVQCFAPQALHLRIKPYFFLDKLQHFSNFCSFTFELSRHVTELLLVLFLHLQIVHPNNKDIRDIPGLAPPAPTRKLLWDLNEDRWWPLYTLPCGGSCHVPSLMAVTPQASHPRPTRWIHRQILGSFTRILSAILAILFPLDEKSTQVMEIRACNFSDPPPLKEVSGLRPLSLWCVFEQHGPESLLAFLSFYPVY